MDTTGREWWRPVVAGAVTIVLFVATMLFAVKTFSVQYAAGVMPCGGAFSSTYMSGPEAVPAAARPCVTAAHTRRLLAYTSGTLTVVGGVVTGLALVDARRRRRGWSALRTQRLYDVTPEEAAASAGPAARPTTSSGLGSGAIDVSRAVEVDLRPVDLAALEHEAETTQSADAAGGAEKDGAYSTVRFGGRLAESGDAGAGSS